MLNSVKASILIQLFSKLIGQDTFDLYEQLDWAQAISDFQCLNFRYPNYYITQNFHGIENGYLNPIAPITYDFVTALATPPNETRIRQRLLNRIQGQPVTILDLGCGTGTGTLMLKQRFPSASIYGVDLSPYMLVMASHKALEMGVADICWQQGLAEAMPFQNESFDLITVSMLFHETPPSITAQIISECFRLLTFQGQILILDGHQWKLRHLKGLTQLFREPYSFSYAKGNIDESLQIARFQSISTGSVGWISQLTSAYKLG